MSRFILLESLSSSILGCFTLSMSKNSKPKYGHPLLSASIQRMSHSQCYIEFYTHVMLTSVVFYDVRRSRCSFYNFLYCCTVFEGCLLQETAHILEYYKMLLCFTHKAKQNPRFITVLEHILNFLLILNFKQIL